MYLTKPKAKYRRILHECRPIVMGASDPTTAVVSQLGGGASGGMLLAENSEHCRSDEAAGGTDL